MGNIEHPTWDTLAKVSTVAEQMRRCAEAAEAETSRLADAQNEYWATIECLEAQHAEAVDLLREAWRYSDSDAPGWSEMNRRVLNAGRKGA